MKITTETEVVSLSDVLLFNIWMNNFLQEQGYRLKVDILFQDNQSAMIMENNGRTSCTGNSQHISIIFL